MSAAIEQAIEKYFKWLIWPWLLVLAFEITASFLENKLILIWAANGGLYLFANYLLAKKGCRWSTAVWLNGIMTWLLTLIIDVVELIIDFKFWQIFNLITEPLMFAAIGALVSGGIFFIYKKIIKSSPPVADI